MKKELQKVLSARAKDSGFKFFKSYIKNIKCVGCRYAFTDNVVGTDHKEDFYFKDYEFEYKGKKYLCKELSINRYETVAV